MSDQRSSSRRSGRPSGRSQASQGRGRGRASRSTGTQPRQASSKFTGNCPDLHGQIFDCSDYKQADTFVHTHKRISEYVGAEYRYGGDISSSLLNERKFEITIPPTPVYVNPEDLTLQEQTDRLIFKGSSKVSSIPASSASQLWTLTSRRPIILSSVSALISYRARLSSKLSGLTSVRNKMVLP